MQQQLMQMQQQQPIMAAGPFTANNITTDHIQQYLDENKSLILKILENQNSGKQGECAENQARLQRNLMYLAAIADCQPQPSSIYAQSTLMQPGTNYLQQQQSQQSVMAARSPILYAQQQHPYSTLQQQQHPYSTLQQQQQTLHTQIGISSDLSSRVHVLQSEETSGSRVVAAASSRNKENGSQSSAENRGGEGESL